MRLSVLNVLEEYIIFDIHSHILPAVDDGARDIDEALQLLEMMKENGITDIIATPHFYADSDNFDEYKLRTEEAYKVLCSATESKALPHIYLGCEVLYFRYIGTCEHITNFCLNGSNYLLLELTDGCITDSFFEDIAILKNKLGIIPIIAHIERYYKAPSFRKLLKFVKSENIPTQVNASSLFSPYYKRITEKLIKKGYVNFLATDSHSIDIRPPQMKNALKHIAEKLGEEYANGLIRNSRLLLEEMTRKGDTYEKQHA